MTSIWFSVFKQLELFPSGHGLQRDGDQSERGGGEADVPANAEVLPRHQIPRGDQKKCGLIRIKRENRESMK